MKEKNKVSAGSGVSLSGDGGSCEPIKAAGGVSVAKSAAFMSLATLLSRILGMVRDMVMALLFPKTVTDAYVVAFKLPNLFRRILGEGSLAASFVPLYVDALTHDPKEAQVFSSSVHTMLLTLTSVLSVLGTIYMPWIMTHLVSGQGFMEVPGKFDLTVFLGRIMFSYLFLVTTYAFYMSVANAHKVFFIPALAPAGFNLITIVMAYFPAWQKQGDQLATGVILGGILQIALAVAPLLKLNVMPQISFQFNTKRVKKFFTVVLPSMLGMSVAQLMGLLNVNFASRLKEGSHSYIYFADRLLEFPQSLLSVSLGVALLPTLSEYWSQNNQQKFFEVLHKNIRLLMVLSLPAAVGLYALSYPIVKVIFGRGEFGAEDVLQTAQVVNIYCVVLIFGGLHRVTVPAFYAIHNTWLPAANSVFCLVVHFFAASWATDQFGLLGLVGATAFSGALNLMILLISFKIKLGPLGVFEFLKSIIWLAPSLVAMWIVAITTNEFVINFVAHFSSAVIADIIGLAVAVAGAGLTYYAVNLLLRHPEISELSRLVLRRLKK